MEILVGASLNIQNLIVSFIQDPMEDSIGRQKCIKLTREIVKGKEFCVWEPTVSFKELANALIQNNSLGIIYGI